MPSATARRAARDAWFIAGSDLRRLLRQRETILWTFVMPILFFYFIGTVTGGSFGDDTPGAARETTTPLVLEVPGDGGPVVDLLARRLREQGFAVVDATANGEKTPRLVLPAATAGQSFSSAVEAGAQQSLRLVHPDTGPAAQLDRLRVTRAVYGTVADLALLRQRDEEVSAENVERIRDLPRTLSLEVKPAGRRQEVPSGYEQAVPGIMVMFTMLVLLTSGAVLLVIEREEGLLRRLASTPLAPGSVVLGKWLARMATGVVQIGFGMVVGTALFHVQWGDGLAMVVLVLVAWASFVAALGLVLANVTRTQAQTVGVGFLVTMVLAALGGCWWPIEITPEWMQSLAMFLPTGWAMDALHQLVSFGGGAAAALPHLIAMLTAAAVAGAVAARTFRYL